MTLASRGPRRTRLVDRPPGGVVADYVPFYFAPRSPMLYSIDKGNVPTYQGGCGPLIYLATTVERLVHGSLDVVVSDRNARLATARFRTPDEGLEDHVDWPLMGAAMWNNTHLPDRKERRMAECLVHGAVPWSVVSAIVTKAVGIQRQVQSLLLAAEVDLPVTVRPGWYF